MVKFSAARLTNGTLQVSGPSTPDPGDPGMQVRHIRFMVTQRGVMVEDAGKVMGNGWMGKTAAPGLKPGAAHGVGLAVMLDPGAPASYQTVTWVERIKITA